MRVINLDTYLRFIVNERYSGRSSNWRKCNNMAKKVGFEILKANHHGYVSFISSDKNAPYKIIRYMYIFGNVKNPVKKICNENY